LRLLQTSGLTFESIRAGRDQCQKGYIGFAIRKGVGSISSVFAMTPVRT
jgi:hypothetical protein